MGESLRPAQLVGKGPEEVLLWVRPSERNRLRVVVTTFMDDDPSGNDTRFDPGIEAASLYAELLKHASSLTRSLTRRDLDDYLKVLMPPSPTEKAIRDLKAPEQGRELVSHSEAKKEGDWEGHFANNKKYIWEAAERLEDLTQKEIGHDDPDQRPVVMVLGAGGCFDIPLEGLAANFKVILVDIDEKTVRATVSRLPADLRPYVSYEIRDLSGGLVTALTQKASAFLENRNLTQSEMLRESARLLDEAPVPVPHLEGNADADFLVSSMLVFPISYYLVEYLNDASVKNGRREDRSPDQALEEFWASADRFMNRVKRAHEEALSDFLQRGEDRVVYYATDIAHYGATFGPVEKNCLQRLYASIAPEFLYGLFGRPTPDQRLICQSRPASPQAYLFEADGKPQQGLGALHGELRRNNPAMRQEAFYEWNWNDKGTDVWDLVMGNDRICRVVNAVIWHNGDE